ELVMTQPVYDPRTLERFLDDVAPLRLPVMVGILPLASHRNAEFLHHEVPGMSIPAEYRERMAKVGAGPAARAEGIRIAQEVLGAGRSGARSVVARLDALDAVIARGELQWARTGADVRAAKAAGKLAALGGIEGGHALEGRVDAIEMFARRGVRYLGPLHLWPNALGGTSRKPKLETALTQLGRDVVRECERCGVIVDLAHINR